MSRQAQERQRILAKNAYYETHIKPLTEQGRAQDYWVPSLDMNARQRDGIRYCAFRPTPCGTSVSIR